MITFEIVTEHNDVISTDLVNVEASTTTHAWRRIGGQLINAVDADDFVILSIRVAECDANAPLLVANQWRLRK